MFSHLKMQLSAFAIVLCGSLVIVRTQTQFDDNGRPIFDAPLSDCGILGSLSGVYCVTEVSFKLNLLDSTIYSCAFGKFCANRPEICVVDGPACQHNRGCDFCSENATSTCVAQKQYATCTDGIPDVNVENCPESTPYCSMPSDKQGVPFVQCSNTIKSMACEEIFPPNITTPEPPTPDPPTPDPPTPDPPTPDPPTPDPPTPDPPTPDPPTPDPPTPDPPTPDPPTPDPPTPDPPTPDPPTPDPPTPDPPTPEPPSPDPPTPTPTSEEYFDCPDFGKFADPSDTTCKTYYYCYNYNGVLTAMEFKCPFNTVFSKEKEKCVFRIPPECIYILEI